MVAELVGLVWVWCDLVWFGVGFGGFGVIWCGLGSGLVDLVSLFLGFGHFLVVLDLFFWIFGPEEGPKVQ